MSDTGRIAFAAYEEVLDAGGDFTPRPGQRRMAKLVAHVMARGTLDRTEEVQERSIAVIDAGTGVGKSLGACVPAIAAALKRKARVIISTATVNLQEQLIQKDLPRFRELMGQDFKIALGKGRSRYVCKVKLARMSGEGSACEDDFFADEVPANTASASEHQIVMYRDLGKQLRDGKWDGERDSLTVDADSLRWPSIGADHHTCTGKQCPERNGCTYFDARKRVADADVVVVNHDLLLASLQGGVLPNVEECLLVIDEAHELAEVASGQFTYSLDLSSSRWINQLGTRINKVGKALEYPQTQEAVDRVATMAQGLQDLQGLVMSMYGSYINTTEKTARLEHGLVPEPLVEPMRFLHSVGRATGATLNDLAELLKTKLEAGPNPELSTMYTALGSLVPRLDDLTGCMEMMLRQPKTGQDAEKPDAKWFRFDDSPGYVQITANVCPQVAGDMLRSEFWPRVRSAVLTSATIRSLGSFDFFLEEVGLEGDPDVQTMAVQSNFDYASQGKLTVVMTRNKARDFDAFNREVSGEMVGDIAEVRHGALALFTSRAHMEMTHAAMPEDLKQRVLVQGSMSRSKLIAEHRRRVDAGEASTILGLQSFGQGVDLPGIYCETVFIAKLPFAPPTDPVGQARAEWLRKRGRDPFEELVVPAVGVKMTQWTGRLIRSETDTGTILCYDRRLIDAGFGRQIRKGLPPYATFMRNGGVLQDIAPLPRAK
jgi:ATP-dependent DNA helicase DinG